MNYRNVSVIIPAYKPDRKLLGALKGLADAGFSDIIVIDDGSGAEFADVFSEVSDMSVCTLLTHQVNRGKGAALKTAFSYFVSERSGASGVVTADADGQHLTCDICAVADKMYETGKVVLGVRDFSDPSTPARSRVGNRITSAVFKLFFGMKISDTQTGLRAIPAKYLAAVAEADGDRYEYETNMLFLMNRRRIPFTEVKITTVYIEENRSSHFRVVRDSVRIYSLILKYLLSSVVSALTDELAYFLFRKTAILGIIPLPITYTSAAAARIISSLVNYFVNSRVVFGEKPRASTLVRYYALAVVQLAVSASLVFGSEHIFGVTSAWLSTLLKTVIDTLLFFISFRIQHRWVFNVRNETESL